jgi:phage minor structural protein
VLYLSQIHITNGQTDQIVGLITSEYILSNNHYKSLKDTLETFQFETLADMPFSEHLGKHNRVIIPDEDHNFIEFVILEAGRYRDTEGALRAEVFTSASYQLLKKSKVINPQVLSEYTPSTAVSFALSGTEWEPATIEGEGFRTFDIEEHTNPYSFLKQIATEFDLELKFRVETNGYKVTGRYVDLLERVGQWRGREIEFGRDLMGIKRTEKTDAIVTALVGIGPVKENGTRFRVRIEDDEALQRWGRRNPQTGEGQHLIEVYEPQTSGDNMTEEELLQDTQIELNRRISEVVEYEVDVADLENVPEMEYKKIRFGDTIKIKDTKFNPPLYLEARVHTQERDITDKMKKSIELGNFIEYTEDEIRSIWEQLQQEIRTRISIAQLQEYAEPKRHEGPEPPDQRENAIWVDTSQTPYVPKVYNFGEWKHLSPTEAYQVNAYSQSETDDIARDASRIEAGIIDVGAVPLRTSVTGARIEWDGLNGLVQYDIDGTPISWLDLEGNAHFENGFFSGEISNKTVTIDHDGVTVNGGNFLLEDSISGNVSYATPKSNLIKDSSFDSVRPDFSDSKTGTDVFGVLPSGGNEFSGWVSNSNARVYSGVYGAGVYMPLSSIFGLQSMILNDTGHVYQYVRLEKEKTYTLSFHANRHMSYTSGGIPRVVIRHKDDSLNVLSTESKEFKAVSNDTVVRSSYTFSVPSNATITEILFTSSNIRFVRFDGVQLVEGIHMAPYISSEDDAYFRGGITVAHSLRTRNLTTQEFRAQEAHVNDGLVVNGEGGASSTSNGIMFPHNHKVSLHNEDFTIYANRIRGNTPFKIRTHANFSNYKTDFAIDQSSGRITSQPTVDNTTTNSANIHVFTSTGRFSRSTSSRRYKILEEPIKAEVTSRITALVPKNWYDKRSFEGYAEHLQRLEHGLESREDLDLPEIIRRTPGLVAEDVEAAGLSEFVQYSEADENGNRTVEGVMYDRLWVLMIPELKILQKKVKELERRLDDYEGTS